MTTIEAKRTGDKMTVEKYTRKYDYTDVMIWGGILLMIIWIIAKALSLLGYI